MGSVVPEVYVIGGTQIYESELSRYLADIGAPDWNTDAPSDAEKLIEFYGRLCYNSFIPGLNPNVTQVSTGNKQYLGRTLGHGHGSIFEHVFVNIVFRNVTRVFTHELVRHRVGVAISQQSLRYVALSEFDYYVPIEIAANDELLQVYTESMEQLGELQKTLYEMRNLGGKGVSFDVKKKATSDNRRLAPMGLATQIGWSANPRTLRHTITLRTSRHAEEEARLVFGKLAAILATMYPNIFQDMEVEFVDGFPECTFANQKV